MRTLEQRVRERVEQRRQIDQRRRQRQPLTPPHRPRIHSRDHAVAIINGVFRDLGIAKAMDRERRAQALARFERKQRRQQERDHHLAISIINGVMARMGMPWAEIEGKAGRGWRVGRGLRR